MFNKIGEFLYRRFRRVKNKAYGYVYLPSYSGRKKIEQGTSNLYNEYGERLDEFFLRGNIFRHEPYRCSRYFIFDRYNCALKTHFYSERAMLETYGTPNIKCGLLMEPPSLFSKTYKMFDKYKGLNKDFDYIFTYHKPFLEKFDNAKFVPLQASSYGNEFVDRDWHNKKTKGVSILSSNKLKCEMHKFRYDLAHKCKRQNLCDTYGTFDGGDRVSMQETLKDYRFSIQIENDILPLWFTERLIACFMNQTIPIYLGATEIDEFFNKDGIIKITTKTDIEDIIKSLTKEEYESRLPAILDNYERARKYVNPWDYMYENYFRAK